MKYHRIASTVFIVMAGIVFFLPDQDATFWSLVILSKLYWIHADINYQTNIMKSKKIHDYITDKDWTSDFTGENGHYFNTCSGCGEMFRGDKYRRVCKRCATAKKNWEARK